jgi:large subunit ribosomal protein L18
MDAKTKRHARSTRHARVRKKIAGTPERPRLAVYRSNRHIYAQLIDDRGAVTLASASDADATAQKTGPKTAQKAGQKTGQQTTGQQPGKLVVAKAVGELLASRAKQAGIERAVFDRGGRLFHGRVAAVAEGAREGGLQI